MSYVYPICGGPMKYYTFFLLLPLFLCSEVPAEIHFENLPKNIINDGDLFSLEWVNDFDSELPSWEKAHWGFETNLCEFIPSNVIIEDGKCKLTMSDKAGQSGEYPEYPYFSAEYLTAKNPQMYGRYAVSMKPNSPSGVVTSFFLAYYDFNDDYSKLLESSEIDIEFCGRTDQVEFALHYVDPEGNLQHPEVPVVDLGFDAAEDYHLWEIEWLPDRIAFYVDGKLLHQYNDSLVLAEMEFPLEVHMNYWISSASSWVGPFDKSLFPLSTFYDFVAFYKWNGKKKNV